MTRPRDAALALALVCASCRDSERPSSPPLPSGAASMVQGLPEAPPVPRKGMVWIPKGALVAGTPPDRLPRIADEEMPGEQVILQGFYIDVFPFPNEEGAIPHSNVNREEAGALCAEQGKRLCSELEWERACKGPQNNTYEYGDVYRAERCGTGKAAALRPAGLLVGCRSEWGTHDMHGGIWEWTSSPWGRGAPPDELGALRGGNAASGELVGRCANAMGRPPRVRSGTIGFRCCAGPKNEAEVVLDVKRGRKLEVRESYDKALAALAVEAMPENAKQEVGAERFGIERVWVWRPIGNEELLVFGGCAGLGKEPACGVLITRIVLDKPQMLGWVSSGHWAPTLHTDVAASDLWLFGGDELGNFRTLIRYGWGLVSIGPKERRVPKPVKKKRKKP